MIYMAGTTDRLIDWVLDGMDSYIGTSHSDGGGMAGWLHRGEEA